MHTHMPEAGPSGILCGTIAGITALWLETKRTIYWIVPSNTSLIPPQVWRELNQRETNRIRFNVRPQFRELSAFAITCKVHTGTNFGAEPHSDDGTN